MSGTVNHGQAEKRATSKADFKGFAAGTLSGLTKLAVGHPFDTIKIRIQCMPATFNGPLDALQKTIGREGLRALYKGASPPAVGWAFSDAILMGSLHRYRLWLSASENRKHDRAEHLLDVETSIGKLAGAMAGWTVCSIVTPIELLKSKLQMQTHDAATRQYTGPIDCAKKIVAHGGPLGLYHGFRANLAFRTWFFAMFSSYAIILDFLTSSRRSFHLSQGAANFWAGGLAAEVYWLGSFPFDTIKNRLMGDDLKNPKYKGWLHTAKCVYSEGGPRAFYRGFLPCMLRAFPTNASAILVWYAKLALGSVVWDADQLDRETSMRLMNAPAV